jgi:hypothetical protein
VLEEALTLDDGAECRCCLRQIGVGDVLLDASETPDDCRICLAEAQYGNGSELRSAEQR